MYLLKLELFSSGHVVMKKRDKWCVKRKTGTDVNVKSFVVHGIQVRRREMAFNVLTCMGKEECTLQNLSGKGEVVLNCKISLLFCFQLNANCMNFHVVYFNT